jgi:DNA-binding transcriptional LysR family regulator
MDLHGFDLNLLIALDALLAEKSVTNAGRRIHLSQSAMSGVLARLRHALNDKLLVASRGGMTLTPLAESLVEPVRSILEQVHRTIIVNVPFDPATSRRVFTIAASDYAVTVLLTDALRRISSEAPGVTVVIIPLRERTAESDDLGLDLVILPRRMRRRPYRTKYCLRTHSRPSSGTGTRVWVRPFTPISIVACRTRWSAFPTIPASTTTSGSASRPDSTSAHKSWHPVITRCRR